MQIITTKEEIINAASREHGGFVNTDGVWCMTRTPTEFAAFWKEPAFTCTVSILQIKAKP